VSIVHRFTARHLFACTLLVVVSAAPAPMTADELCADLKNARELRSKVNKLASEFKEIELTIKKEATSALWAAELKKYDNAKNAYRSKKYIKEGLRIAIVELKDSIKSVGEKYQKVFNSSSESYQKVLNSSGAQEVADAWLARNAASRRARQHFDSANRYTPADFTETKSGLTRLEQKLKSDPDLSDGCPYRDGTASDLAELCDELEERRLGRPQVVLEIQIWAREARAILRDLDARSKHYDNVHTKQYLENMREVLKQRQRDLQEVEKSIRNLEFAKNTAWMNLKAAQARHQAQFDLHEQSKRDRDKIHAELEAAREALQGSGIADLEERAKVLEGEIADRIQNGRELGRLAWSQAAKGQIDECKKNQQDSIADLTSAHADGTARPCLQVKNLDKVPKWLRTAQSIDCEKLIRKGQLGPDRDRPGRDSGGMFPKGITRPTRESETTEVAEADGVIGEATEGVGNGMIQGSGGMFPKGITGSTGEGETSEVAITPEEIQEVTDAIRSATEAMGEGMNVWSPNGMVTVILGEDEEEDEEDDEDEDENETEAGAEVDVEAEAEAGAEVDVEADACAASREYDLVGSWKGCDGRVVTFTLENCEYKGRYTNLSGRLRRFGFKEKELGYIITKMNEEGRYSGQVKWRFLNGESRWADTKITINGNKYTDDGSDSCSRTMARVRE
jgi:hypothetical protein